MDINEFIMKVKLNPPIWDKRIKKHANRNIVDACWKQISSEMMIDGTTLKKKWKYLRDQFSVEFSKIKMPRYGYAAETSTEPKWPYYKSLLFLKDLKKHRASSSNLKNPVSPTDGDKLFKDRIVADNRETKDIGLNVATEKLTEDQPAESNELPPPSVCHLNKKKRMMANSLNNKKILQLDQQKTAFQKEPDNGDIMFFKSLLPYVSKIPPEKKLGFRSRIQQVLDEFALGEEHSQKTSPVPFDDGEPQVSDPPSHWLPTKCKEEKEDDEEHWVPVECKVEIEEESEEQEDSNSGSHWLPVECKVEIVDDSEEEDSETSPWLPNEYFEKSELPAEKEVKHKSSFPVTNEEVLSETSLTFEDQSEGNAGNDLDEKLLSCDLCEKTFLREGYYRKHMLIHSQDNRCPCPHCDMKFRTNSKLKKHLLVHTKEKRHQCDQCHRKFKRKGELTQHYLIHSGQELYSCDQCHKKFLRKENLIIHMSVHAEDRRYSCDHCLKKFWTMSQLGKHALVHSQEKHHTCELCQNQFKRKGDLKQHYLIHSGDKMNTCEQCQKKFRTMSQLTKHKLVHSEEKLFSCNECQTMFKRKAALIRHKLIHARGMAFDPLFERIHTPP